MNIFVLYTLAVVGKTSLYQPTNEYIAFEDIQNVCDPKYNSKIYSTKESNIYMLRKCQNMFGF